MHLIHNNNLYRRRTYDYYRTLQCCSNSHSTHTSCPPAPPVSQRAAEFLGAFARHNCPIVALPRLGRVLVPVFRRPKGGVTLVADGVGVEVAGESVGDGAGLGMGCEVVGKLE